MGGGVGSPFFLQQSWLLSGRVQEGSSCQTLCSLPQVGMVLGSDSWCAPSEVEIRHMKVLIPPCPAQPDSWLSSWLACQLPALTPASSPPACVNVKRCGGNTLRKPGRFHLPAPLVGDQTALRSDANFNHRVCTNSDAGAALEALVAVRRVGTDPVFLKQKRTLSLGWILWRMTFGADSPNPGTL